MKQARIEVFGKVQGVGFRKFVERNAYEYGVRGTTCNTPGGSVLTVVQGSDDDLNGFIQTIIKGNAYSRVESHTVEFSTMTELYHGFRVVR
ncbi:MAG: acylphosphatase [Candidatus Kapabacteria bacterium]|nr:acylphosphatase [Candidatus Kapabacteria bacterium]